MQEHKLALIIPGIGYHKYKPLLYYAAKMAVQHAPDQGVFPEYTGGQREESGTVQIVSRGLAKPLRMFLIPRFFNCPELTVIEISPECA